jgi:hypothetical protein
MGGRQQISVDGGRRPVWSRDGRELFFSALDGRRVLKVSVGSGPELTPGRPEVRFELPMLLLGGSREYDVAPDGTFFAIRPEGVSSTNDTASMVVVLNWTEDLKRLVPTN